MLMTAVRGFSDCHFYTLALLTNISKACFISLFLRLQMKGFSMGLTTAYKMEEIMSLSLESHDEEKK